MTTKQNNNFYGGNDRQYDDVEYAIFCDSLEEQYKQAKKDGLFEILKVLELDKEHSDSNLIQAINYFNKKNGLIEKDAPLLSTKFSEAIQSKAVFLQHSLKFAFAKL